MKFLVRLLVLVLLPVFTGAGAALLFVYTITNLNTTSGFGADSAHILIVSAIAVILSLFAIIYGNIQYARSERHQGSR